MRKSLLLLVALAPLSALAGLALPAVAASGDGSSVSQPAAGALDLDKIPTKPVTGRQSVRGIADDESDDMPALGKLAGRLHGAARRPSRTRIRNSPNRMDRR